jgi:hypothetical protein
VDYSGLNLNTINFLDIGVSGHCGRSHSAPKADNENSSGQTVKRGPQVTQEKLRSGVTRGGVDLAVDTEGDIGIGADNRN